MSPEKSPLNVIPVLFAPWRPGARPTIHMVDDNEPMGCMGLLI